MAKRTQKSDPIWQGYRRAKRSVRPMPLKVGREVIFEDADGRVHRRTFRILELTRTKALIKGWPDGIVRRGPKKRISVPRSSLVDYAHVQRESFKAAFGVPEDTKREAYDIITDADVRALAQQLRRAERGKHRG